MAARRKPLTLDEAEAAMLRRVVRAMRGNVARSAERLGIDRKTLYRKMRRHDLAHLLRESRAR